MYSTYLGDIAYFADIAYLAHFVDIEGITDFADFAYTFADLGETGGGGGPEICF